jgi:energy-coupling factor transporter ATP-binding protein EcfA2
MSKPTLLDAFEGGTTHLYIGPPGTGKSHLCGSICELIDPEKVVLIAPKPREINSYLYTKYGLNKRAQIFRDHRWAPAVDSYEADGYLRLMRYLLSLYEDKETQAVILDPLTDAVQLAAHDLLKAERAATPRELRDSIGFYGALRYKLKDMVQTLVGLASADLPRPKHVLVTIHAQPAKEEDIKGKETADAKAKGIEFFGDVLPMMEGGYRRELAGEFDIVGYTGVRYEFEKRPDGKDDYTKGRRPRYYVQLAPDQERHAKIAISPALAEKELPNTVAAILDAVLKAQQAGAA